MGLGVKPVGGREPRCGSESLDDRDISDIIRELRAVIDAAVHTGAGAAGQDERLYATSRIDFERLNAEFASSLPKNTSVQSLKDVIDKRLQFMLAQNPTRTDFQKHHEDIVAEYNAEKARSTHRAHL